MHPPGVATHPIPVAHGWESSSSGGHSDELQSILRNHGNQRITMASVLGGPANAWCLAK